MIKTFLISAILFSLSFLAHAQCAGSTTGAGTESSGCKSKEGCQGKALDQKSKSSANRLSKTSNKIFGHGADMSKLTPISTLLANPKEYKDKIITVSGQIVSVCKNRGCWMEFASDKKYQKLKIKVQDGKMIFPISLRGKKGFATGKLNTIELSLERTKKYLAHMAKDSGETFDSESVKEPLTFYQLVPEGITIE